MSHTAGNPPRAELPLCPPAGVARSRPGGAAAPRQRRPASPPLGSARFCPRDAGLQAEQEHGAAACKESVRELLRQLLPRRHLQKERGRKSGGSFSGGNELLKPLRSRHRGAVLPDNERWQPHDNHRTMSERMSHLSRAASATMAGTPLPATTRRSALCPKDFASQTAGPICTGRGDRFNKWGEERCDLASQVRSPPTRSRNAPPRTSACCPAQTKPRPPAEAEPIQARIPLRGRG